MSGVKPEFSAIDLRMQLAMMAPKEAATLWAVPNVISFMSEYFDAALSQAYERGQESMRERADGVAKHALKMVGNDQWARGYHAAGADISLSIRSLPIEQEACDASSE